MANLSAEMINLHIILGSTRPERQGGKVAKWIQEVATDRAEFKVELLDLRDWPLPYYQETSSPNVIQGNYSNGTAKKWANKVAEGHAYIIVTPEYNHGYPAVLKNALDYPYREWNNKPVAFVSYSGGPAAGTRGVEQLRLVAIELQMAPIRNAVHIPQVRQVFAEDGKLLDESYSVRATAMLDQLLVWAKALRTMHSGS